MAVTGNAAPRRLVIGPGSRWVVSGSGNTYEVVGRDGTDYVLRLVATTPQTGPISAMVERITVARNWFDVRARKAAA